MDNINPITPSPIISPILQTKNVGEQDVNVVREKMHIMAENVYNLRVFINYIFKFQQR